MSVALGAAGVAIAALARYAVDARDKAVDERVKKLEEKFTKTDEADDDVTERLHAQQLAHAKLEGEVRVLTKSNDAIERDLKEIKDEMVPRSEWREAQERLETSYGRLESKLDNFVRYAQWRPTPGQMPAVTVQTRPLPREEYTLDEYKTVPPRGGKR